MNTQEKAIQAVKENYPNTTGCFAVHCKSTGEAVLINVSKSCKVVAELPIQKQNTELFSAKDVIKKQVDAFIETFDFVPAKEGHDDIEYYPKNYITFYDGELWDNGIDVYLSID